MTPEGKSVIWQEAEESNPPCPVMLILTDWLAAVDVRLIVLLDKTTEKLPPEPDPPPVPPPPLLPPPPPHDTHNMSRRARNAKPRIRATRGGGIRKGLQRRGPMRMGKVYHEQNVSLHLDLCFQGLFLNVMIDPLFLQKGRERAPECLHSEVAPRDSSCLERLSLRP